MKLQARYSTFLTALLMASAFILSACGGGGSNSGTASTPSSSAPPTPTLSSPVTDTAAKQALLIEALKLDSLPLKDITAHRTAESSFGIIPKAAPRLANQRVLINGNWSGMLATAMYAVPGEIVEITVPPELINKGYYIRLSGHADDISINPENTEWFRMPYGIQRSFEITQAKTQVATPYGGAIYIDILNGATAKVRPTYGELAITINGAIEAPYFVLGKTSNAEWINRVRQNPAPYAEFVSDHVAFSVPSSMIRQLDDPESLTRYWDEISAYEDWLGGTETYRTGPDRINFDVQISEGALHAGYPIQTPASATWSINFLKLDVLRKEGEWGFFHELGHERQKQPQLWGGSFGDNAFTFNGGIEFSVNMFAKAVMNQFAPFGDTTNKDGYGWTAYPSLILERAKAAINDPKTTTFASKYGSLFYSVLVDGFEPETVRKILSSYVQEAIAGSPNFPRTNEAKKDQWLIRWSRATGYNMVEYMVNRWKLDASAEAIKTVNAMNLPSWLPATTSVLNFSISNKDSKQLPLRSAGVQLSGRAEFVRVEAGSKHTITENPDGTFSFTPKAGAVGRDQFKVVYRSDAGNDMATWVQVDMR